MEWFTLDHSVGTELSTAARHGGRTTRPLAASAVREQRMLALSVLSTLTFSPRP